MYYKFYCMDSCKRRSWHTGPLAEMRSALKAAGFIIIREIPIHQASFWNAQRSEFFAGH